MVARDGEVPALKGSQAELGLALCCSCQEVCTLPGVWLLPSWAVVAPLPRLLGAELGVPPEPDISRVVGTSGKVSLQMGSCAKNKIQL